MSEVEEHRDSPRNFNFQGSWLIAVASKEMSIMKMLKHNA
jgi:hypothetical protein